MTKHTLRKLYWVASQQIGLDLLRLARMPRGLWRYLRDLRHFQRSNSMRMELQPCLHDWWEQAGAIGNEYFWQDLFVARMIHQANPSRHVDVGSRLDGFVAHLATFREVEVFDVRQLDLAIPGVTFRQADMMQTEKLPQACCDSVSCLHAIEHFGLGRYGDPIEPRGVEMGLASLARLLSPGGTLYLSCPAGNDVVHFNAHRSLRPDTICRLSAAAGLSLRSGWLFDTHAKRFEPLPQPPQTCEVEQRHTLAVYVFDKAVPV
jgi:SAM-dependent methyltransferase